MVRGKISLCLALLLIAFIPAGLWADEEETVEYEPIEVRLETNPANPTVNNAWSVFILVNHPRPEEVSVDSSDFPASLALERIRTDTRTIVGTSSQPGAGSQSERWTRVEFLFTPRMAETIRLPPFEVRINERLAMTEAINIRVQGESVSRYEPRFRWLTPPAGFRIGEAGEITLELINWDPARRRPEDFFRGRAPLNTILEENPPVRTTASSSASAAEGYHYRIVLIPLEGGSVRLETFSFLSDTYTLTVPEITLRVLPAQPLPDASSIISGNLLGDMPSDDITMVDDALKPPFPQGREEVVFPWRGKYRQVIAQAEALWNEKRWAEALAEIRKNERDSPVGPSFVSLRREMEEALGLSVTEDERWRPFGFPLFTFVGVCLVLVFGGALLIVLRGKNVTSRRRYGFIIIIVCTVIGLVLIIPEGNAGFFPAVNSVRSGRIAVLKMTQSYRVPDHKGAVNGWFSEGQPATVGDSRGEWCFAETLDGRSGWVERESVINY